MSNCSAFSCLSTSSILLHVAAGSSYLCSPLSSAALTRLLPLCSAGKEKPCWEPASAATDVRQPHGTRKEGTACRPQCGDRSVSFCHGFILHYIQKKTLKSWSGAELFAGPAALCISRLACVKQGQRRRFWLRCWGSGGPWVLSTALGPAPGRSAAAPYLPHRALQLLLAARPPARCGR